MEANPSGATNVDGAVNRINTLFQPEREPTLETVEEVALEPQQAVEVEADEQPATEAQAQPEAVSEEVETYAVKVNGEDLDVTLEDLRKGYMMESDYRSKTTQVSEKRKALEAKEAEIDADLKQVRSLLEVDIDNLNSPDMLELKEYDPQAYLKEFERVNKKVDRFNKANEKREQELQSKRQEKAGKERELLLTAIPSWLDADTMSKESGEAFKMMETLGFSRDELSSLNDHRIFVMARKAMQFDAITSQDLKSKKDKTPPKTVAPGTGTAGETRSDDTVKAMRSKLRKSGSVKDAAALFRQR